jgi:transcriptional regulator with XRE-family HTH domain
VRRFIRRSAGVPQDDLGAELGVTAMSVSRWERVEEPSPARAPAYLAALRRMAAEVLVGG